MNKLKVAVVGVGNIAFYHINGYIKSGKAEIVAFCDIDRKVLEARGKEFGVTKLYSDVREMLRSESEIDAVSVCTWNSAHAECAIAALEAGKHVLLEKPMAIDAEQARNILAASEKSGARLMIGFVRRFGNDCAIVQDFMKQGDLGEIYYAKATYLRRNGNPGGWFGDKSRSGGGPLIDLGVHVIDLVRYLMGNPKAVSVYGATFRKLGNRPGIKTKAGYLSVSAGEKDVCDVEDLATAMIRFDNGAVLSVEASFSLNLKKDEGVIELFGTKGGVKLDPEFELFTEQNGYLSDVRLAMPTALSFDGLFENEIAHFVDAVAEGTPFRAPGEDGVELMKILDAVYRSAETGHEVCL